MATITKNNLKNGTSYRIMIKVKDGSNNYITRTMTWKKPDDIKDTEARRLVQKVAFEFEEKILDELAGRVVAKNDIELIEYAVDRLEKMKEQISPITYNRYKSLIKELEGFFQKIKMRDLSPHLIQEFLDHKQRHGMVRKVAIMKNKLKPIIKEKKRAVKNFLVLAKVSKPLYLHSQRGANIDIECAKRMCEALGVRYCDYFTTKTIKEPYAKATINAYRKLLCSTLAAAKRQRLVEHNYASKEYIDIPRGTKKEVQILNEEESYIFSEQLKKEKNIEMKTSLMILLYMGLRRSELAGLQWGDINFNSATMKIQRSLQNTKELGKFYKSTKTAGSTREISIPNILYDQLVLYKEWWTKNRNYTIDNRFLDALFKNEDGDPYYPSIYMIWLRKILKQSQLPTITLHALRHTNISLQLAAGVDIKTVASRVGHSMASTTSDIYSHFLKSGDERASSILDSIFE